MKWLDSLTEGSARSLAKRTSRRGFIGTLGAILVGTSTLPLLPVARGASPPEGGRTSCGKACGGPARAGGRGGGGGGGGGAPPQKKTRKRATPPLPVVTTGGIAPLTATC